jgi:membrane fusion protein, multidrug efflux system
MTISLTGTWILGATTLGALFVAGYLPKRQAHALLATEAAEVAREVPNVVVVRGKPTKPSKGLVLPGNLKGKEQTVLFARANGFVQRWLVDLGDSVKQGQLLVELDTPELDREVEQARAGLAEKTAAVNESQASRDYALVNLERQRQLAQAGVASQGDLQKSESEAKVAEAKVGVANAIRASQLANLHRLEQLQSFARVTAPFDGVITARKVDRGTLVSSGSSALYELSSVDPLRVIVDVPQSLALGIKPGIAGTLQVRELPGRTFPAQVARSAGTLDATSRTLRVELDVPNPERAILPGMYAEVTLKLERVHTALVLPASAVLSTKDGLRIAVVEAGGTVKLKPIVVERDNGTEIEIASGLGPSDDVIATPKPFVTEGEKVKTSAPPP